MTVPTAIGSSLLLLLVRRSARSCALILSAVKLVDALLAKAPTQLVRSRHRRRLHARSGATAPSGCSRRTRAPFSMRHRRALLAKDGARLKKLVLDASCKPLVEALCTKPRPSKVHAVISQRDLRPHAQARDGTNVTRGCSTAAPTSPPHAKAYLPTMRSSSAPWLSTPTRRHSSMRSALVIPRLESPTPRDGRDVPRVWPSRARRRPRSGWSRARGSS